MFSKSISITIHRTKLVLFSAPSRQSKRRPSIWKKPRSARHGPTTTASQSHPLRITAAAIVTDLECSMTTLAAIVDPHRRKCKKRSICMRSKSRSVRSVSWRYVKIAKCLLFFSKSPCLFCPQENIVGVNEIYKKLGALVHEQGMTVDSIESNVENTTVRVTQGTEQLRKASHYQNKLRKKKLCICVVAATILFIVISIIVWQS